MKLPIPSDRWLRPLGVILLVLSPLGFVPWLRVSTAIVPPEFEVSRESVWVSATVVGLLGLAALLPPRSTRMAAAVAILAMALPATLQVAFFLTYGGMTKRMPGGYVLLQVPAWTLMSAATPFLWRTALARREFPGGASSIAAGRRAASVMVAAFVLSFLYEATDLIRMMAWKATWSGLGTYGLYSAISLLGRVLIFCCVVLSLRKSPETDLLQARAVRIHQLMSAWFLLMLLSTLISTVDVLMKAQS